MIDSRAGATRMVNMIVKVDRVVSRTLVRVWQLANWVIWQIAIINAISLLRCPQPRTLQAGSRRAGKSVRDGSDSGHSQDCGRLGAGSWSWCGGDDRSGHGQCGAGYLLRRRPRWPGRNRRQLGHRYAGRCVQRQPGVGDQRVPACHGYGGWSKQGLGTRCSHSTARQGSKKTT